MNYIIIESQTTNGTTAVTLPIETRNNLNDALSVYHGKCSVAAISAVPRHAVTLLNERGQIVKYECFDHPASEEAAE